jgi:hypothetical protein
MLVYRLSSEMATRQLPHLLQTDVAVLEAAIQDAEIPIRDGLILNEKP